MNRPALLLASLARLAHAQNSPSLRGSVVDPTGATVPGATVRLESPTGDLVSQTKVDDAGNFLLTNLHAGTFSLVVPAFSAYAAAGSTTLA